MTSGWTAQDRAWLNARGYDLGAIRAQLQRLEGDRPYTRVVRAATLGDGLARLDPDLASARDIAAGQAIAAGRVSSFIPASGAATRLCKALVRAYRGEACSASDQRVVDTVLEGAHRLAVWPLLEPLGAVCGDSASVLKAMFGAGGVGLDRLPKALVPFHRYPDGVRSAFIEHLEEARALGTDDTGTVRLHFTVSAAHQAGFEEALDAWAKQSPATLDVTFSVQDPATDTIAADPAGGPFRTSGGELFFRPGGHGALIGNLDAFDGDIVMMKNVDNILPDTRRAETLAWRRALLGHLVMLQSRAHALWQALDTESGRQAASDFLQATLGHVVGEDRASLAEQLGRPWRVAGMVKNLGQPGGGPFWVDGPRGPSLQIVEGAQIDRGDAHQADVLATATHFNPVELVLGIRGPDGARQDLMQFVDTEAVIVTEKSLDGRPLRALEHPGLWNGAMAHWNTVFVEVPASVFQPVKTLADLLGPYHDTSSNVVPPSA